MLRAFQLLHKSVRTTWEVLRGCERFALSPDARQFIVHEAGFSLLKCERERV